MRAFDRRRDCRTVSRHPVAGLAAVDLPDPGQVRVECVIENAVAGVWRSVELTALTRR
jgi:hypothetical protein